MKTGRSKLKPDVETLEMNKGYRKVMELDFSEMIPFVLSNIRKRGVIPLLYMSINVAFLAFMVIFAIWSFRDNQLSLGRIALQIFTGIVAGSFLVIPPHELLHGLAYRVLGARKIRFGMDLQQFIFYVTADRCPISRNELTLLALTPFVIINAVILAITVSWATNLTLFFTALLLSHNIMCIGDFAMITYAFSLKGEIYTFDDLKKNKSYFYERES
ncbi:MAG: DUF3267 domain-containing protein [Bacteroidales bacterium]|nr:DUF3267 domain-containing protein [Bacteroidales bacterium]